MITTNSRRTEQVVPAKPPSSRRSLPMACRGLPTRQRSWGLAAVAALLIVGFGLAGAVLFGRAGDKVEVLAMGTDVAKGQVVQRADLRSVAVAGAPDTVPVADVDVVVGKTAAVDLKAGQLLSGDMVTAEPVPGPGETVVGLALEPVKVPSAGLAPGDLVDVIAVPAGNAEVDAAGLDDPVVLTSAATVYAAAGSGTSGGQLLLTLVIDGDDAARVAAYSTAGRVAVVETSPVDAASAEATSPTPTGGD